ncbi:MAG: PAS domain S-box protein, partial [Candidatus Marinimicrobia bacterium]|nr:PAS domain S-box protein [Candidatus Neomarinimicrobiota bacterium]
TDGIMKYKTPNIEKWFGWKPEELLGTDGFITVHPDDLERVKNEFVTLLGVEASVKTLEYRYKCKDGSFKPIELTATNLINDPIIQGVLLNYHDISDRNEMDDKLRSSEETFRKAFTTSPDSININRLDDGKYISINQGFTNITGFTEADVQGKSSLEINIWDNPEDREKLAAGLRAHGEVKNLATRFRTKTGGILYGLMSASIMELDGIKHILSITRDITLRERTNRERKRLSAAIEQSTDTIVITDLDGTIIYVNSAFGHSSGYTAEEAVGNNPRVLKSGKHETSFYKQIWDTILNGKTWQGRMINKKKDGSLYTEEASISPVRDSSGSIINFVAVKHDITEHLLLEARLHQSQKLEAIGTMVGGISHEFNNVLQSIFLYAGLVQDELPENEDLRSNFQHILDDGNRASDLIKQILTFSRKTKVAMEPQPLHEMAMEVLVLERASLPATIEIKTDIDMNCGMVFCDKTQISQIIMNLCNNAQHAMEEKGGTLTVSLQQTQASMNNGDPETEALELKVSDTGQGIEAVDLKKIFDPFFTTKELGKGTGLGLSVIHGIVEMMDGQISVTSEIGKGTTFRILFPVTEAVQEGDVIKSSAADVMSRSILLVDDEESIRSVTQIILARKGFKVDSASDGTQALELFKANPGKYDLIVTDQSMPKMSGVELTKAIRSTKSDIPIMLSTGQLGVEDETDFKDIGITAFIQKPWTAVELIERIRELGN